jgi:hypothetical protein
MSKKVAKTRRGRFQPGISGNPGGRPKGSRNKTTLAAMALLEGEAEMLTQRAIDAAQAGDMSALKLVLDRIIPPRRRPVVQFDLEKLNDCQDPAQARCRVIQAALDGELSLDEAERLSKLIIEHMQASDLEEYEWRAQRYLIALMRRCLEHNDRMTKLRQAIANGNIATGGGKRYDYRRRYAAKERGINARPTLCQGQSGPPSRLQKSNNGNRAGAPY